MSQQAREEVATKKDLEKTRQELLEKLATKEELKQAFAKLATKKELGKLGAKFDKLAGQIIKKSADIEIIKVQIIHILARLDEQETKADADRKFDLIMQALDGVVAKIDDFQVEKAATDH